jgi:hypothetical protein
MPVPVPVPVARLEGRERPLVPIETASDEYVLRPPGD